MSALLELAERVEAATGPDRELDAGIAKALNLDHGKRSGFCDDESGDYWVIDECADRFTASLDAALTLVPEGWTWSLFDGGWAGVERMIDDETIASATKCGATPALALCAASLRARAAGESA